MNERQVAALGALARTVSLMPTRTGRPQWLLTQGCQMLDGLGVLLH